MTDTNWKEMLAGLFLSKFNECGYRRLGYSSFKEAYDGLSNLVGGNPLSVRNYRDEFDPVFPNGRAGYFGRNMRPSRKKILERFGGLDLETMAQLIEEQYLGAETYLKQLDNVLQSSDDGEEVAAKVDLVPINDAVHFCSGRIDPATEEGRVRVATAKIRLTQSRFRRWILQIYDLKCCVTGLAVPEVLRASHIVGWSEDARVRMNPSNGLCLSATYDAAFDRHLISFDEDYRFFLLL